ncbi:unnamed protein product [Leptosia nina]|uniref:Helicase ATP-binding domain-containing protein n=1 Tax=Leptosia nina TaxID=320188 RepID=A0AAV1J051_9NEOP
MSDHAAIEISEDDESFEAPEVKVLEPVSCEISSDEDALPEVNIRTRQDAIRKLFPTINSTISSKPEPKPTTTTSNTDPVKGKYATIPTESGVERMIVGVKVNLPVNPYPSQMALMSTVIKAINKSQNCLLESPTGSGKTLALLCAALAVQRHEKNRQSEKQAQDYFSDFPVLGKFEGVTEFIASPKKSEIDNAENFFSKFAYGE